MPKVAFTGGPGVGKTTLLAALRAAGYEVVDEAARCVIAERVARGLSPRPSALEFAREVARRDAVSYESVRSTAGWVLFDRGLVDSLGLLAEAGDLPEDRLVATLARYPFHSPSFVLPPWRDIYRTDAERDQTFEDCQRIHASLVDWYRRCGIALIEVPRGPVPQRVAFVVGMLAQAGAPGRPGRGDGGGP